MSDAAARIFIHCNNCNAEFELPLNQAGSNSNCPVCDREITVPATPFSAGSSIAGYQVQERLGGTHFCDVFIVKKSEHDRRRLMRIYSHKIPLKEAHLKRFMGRIQDETLARQACLIACNEIGMAAERAYLLTDYLPYENLLHELKRKGPFKEVAVVKIMLEVSRLLQLAWEHNRTIHGNLKLANIMLVDDQQVRIADYGLFQMYADAGIWNHVFNSEDVYLSPEQLNGESTDFRTDMFTLGVGMFQLCTNSRPISIYKNTLLFRDQEEIYPLLSEINPAYSHEFSDLLQHMTCRERYDRPESWLAIIHKLEELEAHQQELYQQQEDASQHIDHIFLKPHEQEVDDDMDPQPAEEEIQELKPAIPKSRVEREQRQRDLLKAGQKAGNKKLHWVLYLLIIFTACVVSLVSLVQYFGQKPTARPQKNTNNIENKDEKAGKEKAINPAVKQWWELKDFIQNNPDQTSQILTKLKEFKSQNANSPYAEKAQELIEMYETTND